MIKVTIEAETAEEVRAIAANIAAGVLPVEKVISTVERPGLRCTAEQKSSWAPGNERCWFAKGHEEVGLRHRYQELSHSTLRVAQRDERRRPFIGAWEQGWGRQR